SRDRRQHLPRQAVPGRAAARGDQRLPQRAPGRRLTRLAAAGAVAHSFGLSFAPVHGPEIVPARTADYNIATGPMSQVNLTNHFLFAMPNMGDPYFAKSLTYICEHSEQGAPGLVVNRPIEMTLGTLFERLSLPLSSAQLGSEPVYFGGPVQTDRGFVLHQPVG